MGPPIYNRAVDSPPAATVPLAASPPRGHRSRLGAVPSVLPGTRAFPAPASLGPSGCWFRPHVSFNSQPSTCCGVRQPCAALGSDLACSSLPTAERNRFLHRLSQRDIPILYRLYTDSCRKRVFGHRVPGFSSPSRLTNFISCGFMWPHVALCGREWLLRSKTKREKWLNSVKFW